MSSNTDLPVLINRTPVSAETREWLEKIAGITPVIEKFRDEAERERRMPVPVFEALSAAGIHRMVVSKEFGGSQVALGTSGAVLTALARVDASVAWQMGVQAAIARFSDYLPEASSRELFRDQHALVIGSVNPTGRAEAVPGGYRLSGRWGFASGSAHAEWFVSAAVVTEDGQPRRTPAGGPDIRMLFVPRSQVEMLDTWYTLGLRGTGSEDYRIEDVFVADEYVVDIAAMVAAPPARPSRAYAISYYDWGLFGTAATALGIAQGALTAFKAFAGGKTPAMGLSTLAAGHVTQERVGRAEILVRSARLLLEDAAWHASEHGQDGGDALSAMLRLSASTIAENSSAAVDLLFRLAGSSSIYADSPMERYFRDMHSAEKHITVSPTNIEMAGQYLLGGGLQVRR
ncbi:acyl-CoA dehydrogenase family protein [Kitasatospora sp. NPDC093558]|uniref:acyl-CoA dehydrogenase family protein n=1 Tax=Kitasatospora sp. NPDC093558 TaxID=3155201 RepID=UPI003421E709